MTRIERALTRRPIRQATAGADRDAIVRYLDRTGGWVPIAQLAQWMATELGSTTARGDSDLRTLRLTGRIERRATGEPGGWLRSYEYRVSR